MRKLLLLMTLVAAIFVACDATSEPTQDRGNLQFITGVIHIGAEGGTGEILYTILHEQEGAAVEASSDAEWISDITVTDKITFSVAANTSDEQRMGLIDVTYAQEEYTVAVQQDGMGDDTSVKITPSQRKITVSANGGSNSVNYTITGVDEGTMPKAVADDAWITNIVVAAEQVDFVVEKNGSSQPRETTLTLSHGNAAATIDIIQDGATNEVVLTVASAAVRVGDSVTFTVEFAGDDVTSQSTIHDYYTNELIANPITFNEVGDRAFYAMYGDSRSKVMSISIFPASAPDFPVDSQADNFNFKHRILLIDHTGTDCGYCPDMMQALKSIEGDADCRDSYNIAMAHSYNTSDKAFSLTSRTLSNYFQSTLRVLTGYPTLTFNYQYGESAGASTTYIKNIINKLKRDTQDAAVAVAAKLDGDSVVVSASLKSKVARHYKVNILLLEDGIYSFQSNASAEWMHTHNNAIRGSYANIQYTDITGAEWGYVGTEATSHKVFEVPIDDPYVVAENLKVLVIIAAQDAEYDNKYEVVNTTLCDLDETKPFEYVD